MFNLYVTKSNEKNKGYELKVTLDNATISYNNIIEFFNNFIDELYVVLLENDEESKNNIIRINRIDDINAVVKIDNIETKETISNITEKFLDVSKKYFEYTSIEFAENFHYGKYCKLKEYRSNYLLKHN